MCKSHKIMLLQCDIIFLLCDKIVDLTRVLSCRATLLNACDIVFLAYDQFLTCDRPDLLLFRSKGGTGDKLSKHALGILQH